MESLSARIVVILTWIGRWQHESVDFIQGKRSKALNFWLPTGDAFCLDKGNPGS